MFFNSLADTIFSRPKRSDVPMEAEPADSTPQQVQTQAHRSQLMNWFSWKRPCS